MKRPFIILTGVVKLEQAAVVVVKIDVTTWTEDHFEV